MAKITREKFKTQNDVFDKFTHDTLRKLIGQDQFHEDTLSPLFIGKEANIFRATSSRGYVIVKIYRLETCDFNKMYSYIRDDPRYTKLTKKKRNVIFAWCQREYRNLFAAREAGVRVPLPFAFQNNVLVMEYIGEDAGVALKIKDDLPTNPEDFLDGIIEAMKKLASHGLVHGDLSPFNILNLREKPVLIDFAQATQTGAINAEQLLERDLKNVLDFFAKRGVKRDYAKTLAVLKKALKKSLE